MIIIIKNYDDGKQLLSITNGTMIREYKFVFKSL